MSDPSGSDLAIQPISIQNLDPGETPELSIAQTVVPYQRDDNRAVYLGLRASGFSTREALKLAQVSKQALSNWRADPQFKRIEDDLPKYRKDLANEYVSLEFIRNYRLVLEKDYRVMQASLNPVKVTVNTPLGEREMDTPMNAQDHAYLLKARSHYTPQQLQIMEALVSGESAENFDFTKFILAAASQTKQRVTLETTKKATVEYTSEES